MCPNQKPLFVSQNLHLTLGLRIRLYIPVSIAYNPQLKMQVVQTSDGKIQVPGNHLVQMPDGKFKIFSQLTTVQQQQYTLGLMYIGLVGGKVS